MKEFESEVVSGNLKAMRVRRGLTQVEVAEKLGVSVKTFRRYEQTPEKMFIGYFYKLAELYGCLPRSFFVGCESPIWGI